MSRAAPLRGTAAEWPQLALSEDTQCSLQAWSRPGPGVLRTNRGGMSTSCTRQPWCVMLSFSSNPHAYVWLRGFEGKPANSSSANLRASGEPALQVRCPALDTIRGDHPRSVAATAVLPLRAVIRRPLRELPATGVVRS